MTVADSRLLGMLGAAGQTRHINTSAIRMGGCPSGQRDLTVNQTAIAYGGSNPPPPTSVVVHFDVVMICPHSSVGRAHSW